VHDRRLVHLDDGFGSRWAVAQNTVGAFRVVVFSLFFDQDLCLTRAVEDFPVQGIAAEASIKALAISVFPGAAWFNVCGFCADSLDPVLHGLRNELRAIFRTDERRHAAQDEQVA